MHINTYQTLLFMLGSGTVKRKKRSVPRKQYRYRRSTTNTNSANDNSTAPVNATTTGNATTTTPAPQTPKKYKEPERLRRSNSASTLLLLTFLLYPDKHEYGIAMNNYKGFRVLRISISAGQEEHDI